MVVKENDIINFRDIIDNIYNGDWSVGANKCVTFGYSVYELFDIKEDIESNDESDYILGMFSDRDLAILSVYAERIRLG